MTGVQTCALPISILGGESDEWALAVPVARILTPLAVMRMAAGVLNPIFVAKGHPEVLVRASAFQLVFMAPALWVGARFGGAQGVAIAAMLAQLLVTVIYGVLAHRHHGIGLGGQLRAVVAPALVVVPAAIFAFAAASVAENAWVRVGVGGTVLAGLFAVTWEVLIRRLPGFSKDRPTMMAILRRRPA